MESKVGDRKGKISDQQRRITDLEQEQRSAEFEKNSALIAATLGARSRRPILGAATSSVMRTRAEVKLSNIRAKLSSAKSTLSRLVWERDGFQKELNNFTGNLQTTKAESRRRGC